MVFQWNHTWGQEGGGGGEGGGLKATPHPIILPYKQPPPTTWVTKFCKLTLFGKVYMYAEVESLRARFPGIWTGPP